VTGKAVGQGEKAAQKWLLGFGKHGHIHRTLAPRTLAPRTLAPRTLAPRTLAPRTQFSIRLI
jgi:hypothetical protein